jgi:hypothetical protein
LGNLQRLLQRREQVGLDVVKNAGHRLAGRGGHRWDGCRI